jgi:hypothetical protein
MTAIKLPAIPQRVFSSLGSIPVSFMSAKKADKKGLCGVYDYTARTIKLRPGMDLSSAWSTLWHEAVHVALMDAGVNNTLTKDQEEAVCDAVGAYLTAMMLAGAMKVTPNWKEPEPMK